MPQAHPAHPRESSRTAEIDAPITIRPAVEADAEAAAALYVASDRASAVAARERLRDAAEAERNSET
ncbi:MAG: hypothetical protein H0W06_04785, partial [Chloroflexia bacterium]|nr:hypothetical protein [Chloroflexia bacterium]